ncbi:MalY/PatB family protein [Companilactobacillus nantensis]|uniref:cysteine-S-conjugate beta-lyase n=1 Tax=Companilactobacillus nantensis DSM 16982 TaxID=1423774 RepID=A0A0R1WAQ7_9LACO|nr:PatB family C-S lyase [Companilactobacillus nantensis]KRM14919.1 aminotransferase [Companilactobacillus nantensis DSM 16982]GEO64976.1 cystathionine beta-lyase [Companilactobacillus nantensis]
MSYDFETLNKKRAGNSAKWDVRTDELPMTIADMDFQTAPEIVAALQEKIAMGLFGYEEVPTEYFQAVADWYATEHNVRPQTDWMIFATGVVPAISSAVRRLTSLGDNVLVQAPVYNIFYNSIVNNGRHVVSSDLVYDADTNQYAIDFVDLENKLSDPLTNMMILCNPHNPVGKIWSIDELTKIASLCQQYDVKLFSDEIHGDLTLNESGYNPIFGLDAKYLDNVVVAVSPSKTFNVAAMHAATVLVPNANLRGQVSRGLNSEELAEPNFVAIPGTIAAYTKGHVWLQALKDKLRANRKLVLNFLAENIPEIKWVKGEATYLLWFDVAEITDNAEALAEFIRKDSGLIVTPGSVYGGDGQHFIRMNIASPTEMIQDGLNRLQKSVHDYQNK